MPKTTTISVRPSLSLRLEKFRLFSDTKWFRLAPLTILVGRNSSGKSSIINSLLLLKQSIEHEAMTPTLTPLSLVGPYCDLGNYADLVHNHDEASPVAISFGAPFAALKPIQYDLNNPLYRLSTRRSHGYRIGYYTRWSETKLPSSGSVRARLSFSANEPFGPSLNRMELAVDNVGAARLVRTVSGELKQHWRIYSKGLPPRSLIVHPSRAFFPFVDIREASYNSSDPRSKHSLRTFIAAVQGLFSLITRSLFLSNVIGPFRTPPERRYTFAGLGSTRNLPSGEGSVDLMITELLLAAEQSRPLHDAASFWIRHLRLADSLDVRDIAKRLNLFEIDVAGAGRGTSANLSDVGFGLSQILPVVVQGLQMRPGSIYLVQQPEIHLHPDAQADLADFFIYLATKGVMTIVETHSEYLLLRIRRRLAEGGMPVDTGLPFDSRSQTALTKNDVSVVLTDYDSKDQSRLTELEIGDAFQFNNLPTGFMNQAMQDRLELLKALGGTYE